jgi:hypothetical protein
LFEVSANGLILVEVSVSRETIPRQEDEIPDRKNSGKNSYIQLRSFRLQVEVEGKLAQLRT